MKLRWRYWLLPLLTIGMFISVFEVNTDDIVNTWGDAWDTYLPAEFTPDPVQAVSVAYDSLSGIATSLVWPVVFPVPVPLTPAIPLKTAVWLRYHELFLRWCQWRI